MLLRPARPTLGFPLLGSLLLATVALSCVAPNTGGGGDDPGADAGNTKVPPPPEVEVLLDREVARLTGGTSTALSFTVPDDGFVSVTVTIEGDARDQYYVSQWSDDTGFTLVAKDWINDNQTGVCTACKNRVTLGESVGAAIAPNAPNIPINAGVHTIRVSGLRQGSFGMSGSNATAYVTVHAKRGIANELPETGVLDLNLHFTGVNGWTAASAPQSSSFQRVIQGMREVYETQGITLGQLNYFDVPSEFRVIESISGADSDLNRLFETSADHPDVNAVNLYFVEEISSDFGVILGIAGGIPGPVKVQGTPRSGVAIVGKRIAGAGGDPALTAAHEAGHYLGLFHTTEYGWGRNRMHDQLDDTPQNDESYLMHASGSGETLSPWQGRIIRLNPWTRTHPDE